MDGRLFVPAPDGELLVYSVNTLQGKAGESTEEVAQGIKRRLMAQDPNANPRTLTLTSPCTLRAHLPSCLF